MSARICRCTFAIHDDFVSMGMVVDRVDFEADRDADQRVHEQQLKVGTELGYTLLSLLRRNWTHQTSLRHANGRSWPTV